MCRHDHEAGGIPKVVEKKQRVLFACLVSCRVRGGRDRLALAGIILYLGRPDILYDEIRL